ncbi:sensor histidine kinase [Hymenobacter properus]|uniref:Histidine kinase n=1 Tax=Hymenobacter properus TaxID=2791026 RepID=A0A931BLA9_9BACT|nr:histidine kinase [Hymenobacter properus]MBF9144278.1 histidine kinase [Hymenobacter properus]MBR7723096.1 histidine kinase [Microvirga sp. SRT04]
MPALNDRRFLLWGIPLLSLFITAFTLPAAERNWPQLLGHWAISMYFTTGYWLSNRLLWRELLRRLPRPEQTPRRLWLLAGLALLTTIGASVGLFLPMHGLLPRYFPLAWGALLEQIRFSLVPTVAVLTLYEAMYFFEQWKDNLGRAEQLARAQTQARLDALQSQLDPHFLFNNLNTLAALIEPENEPAQQFVEQLADVYRYVLLAQGQATVPLAEELAFVETYLALHKARFRDNLAVEVAVPAAALARRVAPLSVQLLVENALKHNEASRQHPLHLRLWAPADAPGFLLVENTLRPRTAGLAPGTGTGLANVRRRYELLHAARPVEAGPTAGKFVVKLPLLSPHP